MKKTIFLLVALCIGLGVFTGCSSEEETAGLEREGLINLSDIYIRYSREAVKANESQMQLLVDGLEYGKTPIENFSQKNILAYLLTLNDSQLDSIIQVYSPQYNREELESAYDDAVDTLIVETSEREISEYFSIINSYAENDGNLEDLDVRIENLSPKIREYVVGTIATYDALVDGVILDCNINICRVGLDIQFMKMASMLVFAEFAPLDEVAFITEAAYTVVAFHACMKTGHWY